MYEDAAALGASRAKRWPTIRRWSSPGEARELNAELAKVAAARPSCSRAATAPRASPSSTRTTSATPSACILQMAVGADLRRKLPVVKVGRMAGQFAKPRSSADRDDRRRRAAQLPRRQRQRHRLHAREPHAPIPQRMVHAYSQSAATLNLLRAFASGGYANLHQVHHWTLDFMGRSPWAEQASRDVADRIGEALDFMEACGIDPEHGAAAEDRQFYTSHEALLLPYEQALTRQDSLTGDWYDTSAHMLWIGDRTRFEGSAHVEFLRGIGNPIGMKCGPQPRARRAAAPARHAQSRRASPGASR